MARCISLPLRQLCSGTLAFWTTASDAGGNDVSARKKNANVREKSKQMSQDNNSDNGYWAANIRLVTVLLIIWALVSYGFGILLRPMLSGIDVGGVDLGFWFAQQGSIYVFLVLIFVYAIIMNGIDRSYGVDEE